MENYASMLVLLFIFSIGCVYSEIVAAGTSYTFKPKMQNQFEGFDWRHNEDLVVEWDALSLPVPHWYRYKERANLNTTSGELTLQVKKEDSGEFTVQFQVKEELQYFKQTIKVIEPISNVIVTCERNGPNITLLCSVDPPVPAEFSWTGPSGFTHIGENVQIPTVGPSSSNLYICSAKNELHSKGKEFSLENCPKSETSVHVAAILVPIILLIIIALAVVGIMYYKRWKNADAPGCTTAYSTVSPGKTKVHEEKTSVNVNHSEVSSSLSNQDKESQGA